MFLCCLPWETPQSSVSGYFDAYMCGLNYEFECCLKISLSSFKMQLFCVGLCLV